MGRLGDEELEGTLVICSAVECSALQRPAVHCSALQCTEVQCTAVQSAVGGGMLLILLPCPAVPNH